MHIPHCNIPQLESSINSAKKELLSTLSNSMMYAAGMSTQTQKEPLEKEPSNRPTHVSADQPTREL